MKFHTIACLAALFSPGVAFAPSTFLTNAIRRTNSMSSTTITNIPTTRKGPLFATVEATAPTMNRSKTKAPVFDEVCETCGVTLTRFMAEVGQLNPEISELITLFGAIDTSCKAITNLVKRSQLPSSETLGYQGEVNVQGEDQKKLDVITNDLLKRALRFTGKLGVLASEEEDAPVSFLARKIKEKTRRRGIFCILIYSLVSVSSIIYFITCE